jgi:hypothetical protein
MEEYPEKQASEIARKAAENINSAIEWHGILSKSRILISAEEERVSCYPVGLKLLKLIHDWGRLCDVEKYVF